MSARTMFAEGSVCWAALVAMCLGTTWSLNALAQSSPSPYTYATRYDLMGRVTGTIAPDPDGGGALLYQAVRNTYDAAGRLTKVESGELSSWFSEATAPASWSGFTVYKTADMTYSAQNQKTLEVVKGSDAIATAATQFNYDAFGRVLCTAVRMNPAVYASLPDACTLGTEGSFGPDRITKNFYDTAGRLTKVQKAVGTTLVEDYATYTYSPNANRISVTDARGYKASMGYDGLDRQSTWNFPCPTELNRASPCQTPPVCPPNCQPTADFEQYGYDENSNRTSLRKRDNSLLTYEYDALNRMTRKVVPERSGLDPTHTRDVYYGYDSFSRMTFARFDSTSGQGVTTGYNGFSEATSSTNTMPGTETTFYYQYDADGNRTRVTFGDGRYVTYAYDGLDRPSVIQRDDSTTLAAYTYNSRGSRAVFSGGFTTSYSYHPDGRLSALTNTPIHPNYNAQYTFSYNPASQISQQTRNNDAFAWTAAANTNQSYIANGQNQYISVGGTTFAHDANGNLTSDGATTFTYDIENRLVSASGAKNAQLVYDPLGRLYAIGGFTSTTRFAYDGDALMRELDPGGNLLRRYVHGADAGDDPIAWFEGAGFTNAEQRLLRTDHQGSVVAVADATSAGMHAINSYDEYGMQGTSNQGRFQYTGQTWMPELGLYYYKARMYSPALGRFMQTDPIGYQGGMNLYAYVDGDPINATDPTGLKGRGVTTTSGECTGTIIIKKDGACGGQGVQTSRSGPPVDKGGKQDAEYQASFSEAWNEEAAELFKPLAFLGDNATDFWAQQGGVTGAVFGTLAATVNSNNIGNTVGNAGTFYLGGALAKGVGAAAGPAVNWLRIGSSYSQSLKQPIALSLRWGAGGKYYMQIPNGTLRGFNQWLRKLRIPIPGWRFADPGHLHLVQ